MNASPLRTATLAATIAVLLAGPAAAQQRLNLSSLASSTTQDRFIVKYRDGSAARTDAGALRQALTKAAGGLPATRGARLTLTPLRRMAIGAEVVQANRKLDRADAESLMRQIAADPNVEYVEADAVMRAFLTPNDTYYNGSTDKQWHYFEATGGLNLPSAWDKSTGQGVVVAVVDSGILSHGDLNANILAGYDMVSTTASGNGNSNDGNGRDGNPLDSSNVQHGTHVAGTIAAVTNNGNGVAGVAYNAKVVPVRVLGQGGYGSTSDIADGIVWASGGSVPGAPANANPAEVINLSLGGSGSCSNTYQSAINTAVNRGAVVVIAAGNSAQDVANFTPANCANVIAVAATNRAGAKAGYSNYGSRIDVSAPGGETDSVSRNGVLSTVGNNGSAYYQGTSMATPHVAGVAALMQAAAATPKTPAQIEQILKQTARALPGSCYGGCGAGIVDATAAVNAVLGGGGGGGQTYTNSADYAIYDNATVDSPITVSGRSGNAPSNASVAVNIVHTYRGDVQIDLIAPDGSAYRLKNSDYYDDADNVNATYTVNLSSEALNGTWKLRVADVEVNDTGYINSWSVTF